MDMDHRRREAEAALLALKDAAITRSTKGDWRLVAAAQAIRHGAYSNEFLAAKAMGKPIAQRREVANWLDKLAQLEQRQSQPHPRRSARLLVQRSWIQQHLPGVQLLEPPSARHHPSLRRVGIMHSTRWKTLSYSMKVFALKLALGSGCPRITIGLFYTCE